MCFATISIVSSPAGVRLRKGPHATQRRRRASCRGASRRARIVRMSSAFQRYLGGEVEWRTESRNEGSQQHGGDRASASPSPLQPRASDFRLPGLSPPWLGYPPAFLLSADVGVPQPLLLLHPRPSVRPGVHQDRRLHAVRHAGFRDVGKLRESAETACAAASHARRNRGRRSRRTRRRRRGTP